MPRKPRVDIEGYHLVINEGVAGRKIFYEDEDYNKFLDILCSSSKLYNFTVHSYCLLHDHYHLLIETMEKNISMAIRYVNSNYAVFFNKKYNRTGHLWRGRYKSWYIMNKTYLDNLVLHIEQHPKKSHLCDTLENFKYSSYRAFANLDKPIECLKKSFIFKKYEKIEDMKVFFNSPVDETSLGELIEKLQKITHCRKNRKENTEQKSLSEYFKEVKKSSERNKSIYKAYTDGYTQTQIAAYLNISQATISNVIKKFLQNDEEGIICI